MNAYNVYFCDNVIGNVILKDTGLYTQFNFRCEYIDGAYLRLIAEYDDLSVDLGICCANSNGLYINTRVPKKKLGIGVPHFHLKDTTTNNVIIFDDKKPFERLKELPDLKYTEMNGQKCLFVVKHR